MVSTEYCAERLYDDVDLGMSLLRMFASQIILSAFFALAVPAAFGADWGLTLTTPRSVIGVDDDLLITVTLTVPDEHGWSDTRPYEIEIRDNAGKNVPDSSWGARLKMSNAISINGSVPLLSPKGEKTRTINLSELFDIPGAGNYTVSVAQPGHAPRTLLVSILPVNGDPTTPTSSKLSAGGSPAGAPSTGPHSRDLSLDIKADRNTSFADTEVHVSAELANRTESPINVGFDGIGDGVDVAIHRLSGGSGSEAVSLRESYARLGRRPPTNPLRGGGQVGAYINLSERFDLTQPGTYSVQLYYKVPENQGGGEIRSNVITIAVRQRRPLP
jgi:hypothetical protein